MKFANLILDTNKKMENVGDWVQIFAIENLYNYMNIKKEDIIRIKISELSTYEEEYVILPINYPLYGYYNLSHKIIPVYLGVSIMNGNVAEGLRMQHFQPIGCRDYHTMKELQKKGIEAYYGGCLTITLPKKKNCNGKKTFIVDISDNALKKIPSSLRENAEYVSHVFYDGECGGEEKARKLYQQYYEEAGLVITSRIHCAQPCMAAGIPVIFICEIKSFRYEVIRQFIPIYTLDEIEQINWNPKPIDLEEHKNILLENASERINETYQKYNQRCKVSDFYLRGVPLKYEIDSVWAFQRYIEKNWKKEDMFEYAMWGITQIAETLYEWIGENYPKAILKYVIDNSVKNDYHEVKVQKQDGLINCSDIPVFVTAGSINPIAENAFKTYGVKKYVVCYGGLYIVNGKKEIY